MKRLILGALLLQACGKPGSDVTVAAQIALSDKILERLEEKIEPAPGAAFAQDVPPLVSGGHSGAADTRKAFTSIGFELGLEGLKVAELSSQARKVDARFKGLEAVTSWADALEAEKKGASVRSGLAHAVALLYADRFSGLGLQLTHRQLSLSGSTLDLSDPTGANVIQVSAWISIPAARAYVNLSYFAHSGERDVQILGKPAPWGTRH